MSRFAAMVVAATAMTLSPGMDAFADDQEPATAHARLQLADGTPAGEVMLTETPSGVLIEAHLTGLPQGTHGFHIHQTGACEPDFDAAGGHLADPDGQAHGFLVPGGPHLGDLENIHVPETGELTVETFNTRVSLDENGALMDGDGAAILVHSGPDDYRSQPSGDAGDRIACGVIVAG
ncbi:MAG: hypothetical protein CMF74_00510 [Maricaulis sp.]|jgi:Cu-Zn family superoxide dismutase|nr:hypothetical protein [Maricaulis sp.]HAQ35164.1 hypothetical protein [Alphaproteobacteria bacterium]